MAEGHSVEVITSHPHYPEWRVATGYGGWRVESVHNSVPLRRLAHYVPRNPSSVKRLLSELSFGLRAMTSRWSRPDLVLVVSPALFSSAMVMLRAKLRIRPLPVVFWVQDIYSLGVVETGAGGGGVARLMKAVESWVTRRAERTVVIHERFRNYFTSSLRADPSKVDVVRNWTHLPVAPKTDRAAVREAHGWRSDETVVLHAGNQGVKQGLENVVEAAREADRVGAPVRFVLLGDGNQRERLEATGSGIERLQFIDPLPGDEFQKALASADILLVNELPGLNEMAVPSKLTSYFSTGLPVIAATDEGSITHGEIESSLGGVRVDAGQPAALLTAAEELARDENRARDLGQNGLKYRTEVLTIQHALSRFTSVCERAAVR